MHSATKDHFIRNSRAGSLLEVFLVSAVIAVLGIRSFLHIAGYPQFGGDSLHIAHMLYGGFLMLGALITSFSFIDKRASFIAAILGGLGFGAFIDEIGKFITQDNDYFFQPAIALIYLTFVILFLIFRHLSNEHELTDEEREVNKLLEKRSRSLGPWGVYSTARDSLHLLYKTLLDYKWFLRVVVAVVIFNAGAVFARTVASIPDIRSWVNGEQLSTFSFIESAELTSSLIASLLVVWGVIHLKTSRLKAYRMFRAAILLSIFITHFFVFFREELGALIGLTGNILVLIAINYMIREEEDSNTV